MSKPNICFEQVPLEVVRKILEDQAQQKENGLPGAQRGAGKNSSEAAASNGGARILPQKGPRKK